MNRTMQQKREKKLQELIVFCNSEYDYTNFETLLVHIAIASRLVLLGRPEFLIKLLDQLRSHNLWEETENNLHDYWLEVSNHWFEYSPDELAVLLMQIQDFVGLWACSAIQFSAYTKSCWDVLMKREQETILDDETADKLNEYHAIYPVSEDECISSIRTPVTFTMLELLEDVPPINPSSYPVEWNSRKNVWEIDAQEKGKFAVSWQNTAERAYFRVFPYSEAISFLTGIGSEPVIHNAERPQNWIVPYRKSPEEYIKKGFTLRFEDGSEATIPLNESCFVIQPETLQVRKQNILKREPSLLAADSARDFDYFTIIWQLEETGTKFSGTILNNNTFRVRTNDSKTAVNISKIIFGGEELVRQNDTSWTTSLKNLLEFVKGDFSANWTLEVYMKEDQIPYILNSVETEND